MAQTTNDDLTRTYKISNDLEIPPLRSLDDFLLSSARFQVPQFNDPARWNNRIVCNLLYYQTNYGIVAAALFFVISLIYPRDIILGVVCIAMALAIAVFFLSKQQSVADFKRQYPYVGYIGAAIGGLLLMQMSGSLMMLAFSLAFPLLVILLHASFRLRNVKNKIANKAESAGVTKTVMGRILDGLGMKPEMRIE